MTKIVTRNSQGMLSVVGETNPLPVTLKDTVPFYFSQDVETFMTEIDPCLWRRAIDQLTGAANRTTLDTNLGWTYAEAGMPNIRMRAQRGVSLLYTPSLASGFKVGLIDTQNNGALIETVSSINIYFDIEDFNVASGEAQEFYRRCKPIKFRTRDYIPTTIHFISQSSVGAQNAGAAQQQVLSAYIGAIYPTAENSDSLNTATARWIVMPISQANNVQFGRFTLPATHSLTGLASGSNIQVGSVTYSFPFPTITPFWPTTANPPSWYWYFVALGYTNLTTSAVQHPWGAVWVEAEVRPQ